MKIGMGSLGGYGRLGNSLFQLASTMGLAEKYGAQAVFPEWKYEKYFENVLTHGEIPLERVEEKYFHHHDWKLTGDCDVHGYLQSEKYFGSERLKFKPEFIELVRRDNDIFQRPTICIQVRRGDYVGNKAYYQMPVTFYIDALLTYFPKWRDCHILFVSDDIEYCKVHFECLPNAFFSSGRDDIYDMALASCCDDFIISNSSFGWWCAWLGEKPHSKIIHSGFLHSGRLSKNDPRDYRPERWTAHKKDAYVIDLSDVTFTIPLLFDHQDRKENMELVLYFLQSAFDTNFMICEQGGDIFEYMNQWAEYSQTDSKKFHRTKMLNDMANQAETEIIVNWDCDVIIPPMQVYMAVDELRAGADMVYPYGGGFARMPRNPWFSIVQKSLDIGIVGKEPFKHRGADENSVGGAVMFNRESFLDGGGENENMISFGPEDCERHDRFKLLGYTIRRVGGALYHLNHHTGENSTPRNPFYQDNQAEIEKVRRMTKIELRAYVDSWTWRNQYTNRYYSRISEGAVNSAAIVMEALSFRPASVIDIGCGLGEWNNWHSDYTGLDYRIEEKSLMISRDRYIDCNLEMEFIQLNRKFDLCLCLEVAEHLRPHRAVGLVEMLCGLSDRVLFSAAIPYQGGQGHINERFQSYWAGLFLAHGFGASKEQPDIRYNPGVELWYRQNLILYERGAAGVPQGDDIVEDFVLPEYYLKIAGHLRNRAEGKK